jgi:hypothetical protein
MKFLAIAFALLPTLKAYPQPAKLIEATMYGWAGGIAGRRGEVYTFRFEVPAKLAIVPDSVWVAGKCFKLEEHTSPNQGNFVIEKTEAAKRFYRIFLKTAETEPFTPPVPGQNKSTCKPPLEGPVALISYRVKTRRHLLRVENLKMLPFQSYP